MPSTNIKGFHKNNLIKNPNLTSKINTISTLIFCFENNFRKAIPPLESFDSNES